MNPISTWLELSVRESISSTEKDSVIIIPINDFKGVGYSKNSICIELGSNSEEILKNSDDSYSLEQMRKITVLLVIEITKQSKKEMQGPNVIDINYKVCQFAKQVLNEDTILSQEDNINV